MSIKRIVSSNSRELWSEFMGLDGESRRKRSKSIARMRDEIVKDLDENEDGYLVRKETGLTKSEFSNFDFNDDGKLSSSEIKRGLRYHYESLKFQFSRETKIEDTDYIISITKIVDLDRDGSVTGTELAQAMPDEWQLAKVGRKFRLDGKVFTKQRQALMYAFVNTDKALGSMLKSASESEEILNNLLAGAPTDH